MIDYDRYTAPSGHVPITWELPPADPDLYGTEYGPVHLTDPDPFPWPVALRVWAWCAAVGFVAGVVVWTVAG